MVSLSHRIEAATTQSALITSSFSSSSSTKSFAQQLARALDGDGSASNSASTLASQVSSATGQNSGGSQFLATGTTTSSSTSTSSTSTATGTTAPGTMEQLFSGGPVTVSETSGSAAPAACTAPMTESQAYWAAQPPAVQVLQNMPDSPAKDQLALSLANQGYSIDTQIMVWGWDPQATMAARQEEGYSWVPSYGQSPILVAPGVSDPFATSSYNPASPPAGSIQVSTAFAAGTVISPVEQMLQAEAASNT